MTRLLSPLATAYSLQPVLLFLFATATLTAHAQQQAASTVPLAHFHHVHLNTTDPSAAIAFYTSKFKARKESFAGAEAVWTGDSWLLFTKVEAPPPSELLSGIWHIGWGAEDMQSTYQQQLDTGTRFATPLTDISDLVGGNRPFFYAYVDGPDHVLIELNTARHHNFGHVHLFSADPPAAGAWYAQELGVRSFPQTEKRIYRNVQIAPAAFVTADHLSMIIYPVEYRGGPIVATRGRAIDHLGFSVDDLGATLARLRQDGVKVTAQPRSSAGGKLKSAFIEGPDQVAIELLQDETPRPGAVTD